MVFNKNKQFVPAYLNQKLSYNILGWLQKFSRTSENKLQWEMIIHDVISSPFL